jgi:hypothetical protein
MLPGSPRSQNTINRGRSVFGPAASAHAVGRITGDSVVQPRSFISTFRNALRDCLFVAWGLALAPFLCTSVSAYAVDSMSVATTTSSFAGSLASPDRTTGTVSLANGSPRTTYTIVHAFQALPEADDGAPNRFYSGTYAITFTCATGSGVGSAESIGSGGAYPVGPPPSNKGAPTITTDGSGNANCDYTLKFSGSAPAGSTISIRSDIWVLLRTTLLTQTAGPQVTPPFTGIPEAPSAVLLPVTGFLALIVVGLFRHRLQMISAEQLLVRRGRGSRSSPAGRAEATGQIGHRD